MAVELDSYQKEAIDKLKNGSILCGGVGSGKSRTGIAYYFCRECGGEIDPKYKRMKNPKDLYIITTAKKRDDNEWDSELIQFLLSTDKKKSSYDISVTVDSWNNIKKYTNVKDAFFIFDEQRLVGYGAWVKAFFKIAKANHWILLTATPGDTWTDYIPVFIANGFYKNKTDFEYKHVVYKYFKNYKQVDRYLNQGRLIKLRNEILVDMNYIRPTVHHDKQIIVDYDKEAYKELWKTRFNKETGKPVRNISELCYLSRKFSNLSEDRLNKVLDLTAVHSRAIIFYNFDCELEALKNLKYAKGTVVKEWNGYSHDELPKSKRWVYLVQYSAGAEGWNCTETDTIIFYSLNYSYKTTIQAKGRIDRRNTPYKDLYYFFLRSNSPIDIRIARSLKSKKNFNEKQFVS